jgi:hypothetical protein
MERFVNCTLYKASEVRLADSLTLVGDIRNTQKILVEKPKIKDHFEDVALEWRLIL